jgi:hypothetical protein
LTSVAGLGDLACTAEQVKAADAQRDQLAEAGARVGGHVHQDPRAWLDRRRKPFDLARVEETHLGRG